MITDNIPKEKFLNLVLRQWMVGILNIKGNTKRMENRCKRFLTSHIACNAGLPELP